MGLAEKFLSFSVLTSQLYGHTLVGEGELSLGRVTLLQVGTYVMEILYIFFILCSLCFENLR